MRITDMMKTLYMLVKMQDNADQNTLAPGSGSLLYRTAVKLSEMKDMAMLNTSNQAHAQSSDGEPMYVWKQATCLD